MAKWTFNETMGNRILKRFVDLRLGRDYRPLLSDLKAAMEPENLRSHDAMAQMITHLAEKAPTYVRPIAIELEQELRYVQEKINKLKDALKYLTE